MQLSTCHCGRCHSGLKAHKLGTCARYLPGTESSPAVESIHPVWVGHNSTGIIFPDSRCYRRCSGAKVDVSRSAPVDIIPDTELPICVGSPAKQRLDTRSIGRIMCNRTRMKPRRSYGLHGTEFLQASRARCRGARCGRMQGQQNPMQQRRPRIEVLAAPSLMCHIDHENL